MHKQFFNRIFSSRVFYIIFALLVSVALWMYVEITENELIRVNVDDIEVVFTGMELLRDRGLLISMYQPDSVSVTFETSRSIANELRQPGAVTAEIDLSSIRATGSTTLPVGINLPEGVSWDSVEVLSRTVDRISLLVDRLRERPIEVRVIYRGGTASEELVLEPAEFNPRTIMVEGPEEVLSRIAYAYVPIPREVLSETFTEYLEFVLFDENDDPIDEALIENLVFSQDMIRVTIPVRQMRDVPLTVILMHGAGSNDANTIVTIDPPFITLSGEPDAIRDVNQITLGTVNMTGFGRADTEEFWINVPNIFTNLSGEAVARVMVEVVGLEIDFYSTTNLHVVNTPPGHTATVFTNSLDVRIRGTREDLDLVTETSIRVVADISDMSPGRARVPATVYVDGVDADVGAVSSEGYFITVTIRSD